MSGRYVGRRLTPASEAQLREWWDALKSESFSTPALDDDPHVTVAYSEADFPCAPSTMSITARAVAWGVLGSDNAVVLYLDAPILHARYQTLESLGMESSYDSYKPHVTLYYLGSSWNGDAEGFAALSLPDFVLVFGPELSSDLDTDVFAKSASLERIMKLATESPIVKVDDDLRLVWGWANVSKVNGETVTDHQDDIIEIEDMRAAAHEFMKAYRTGGEMHETLGIGTVVESMVFSAELQKALGIDLGQEGWFIGVHVTNDDVWKRVKSGELKAFSIGGSGRREPVSTPAAS